MLLWVIVKDLIELRILSPCLWKLGNR